jgi:ABC-type sugar transport system permease subunit
MFLKKGISTSLARQIEGSIFIAPWVIGFLLFMAFPIGYSFYMSFHEVKILATGIDIEFKGLEFYKYILFTNGGVLYNNLIPFLQQALMMIPIIVIFALLVAIILNQKFAGRSFFRVVFFLPVIFTSGEIINEFMTQGQGQLGLLEKYNITDVVQTYLTASWANPIIALLNSFILILWYSGVQIIIFLAGRQTIPSSVYEAASIDGSGPWETFWKITLPAMTPFILLNSIYTVVDLFTFPTNPILDNVNTKDYGMSSALAWIYFSIIFVVLAVIFFIFMKVTKTKTQQ